MKYYWLSFKIFLIKPFVKIQEWYTSYKKLKLELYCSLQILQENNYSEKCLNNLRKYYINEYGKN